MFFAIQASAQKKADVTTPQQPHVQWVKYLSDMEKAELARKLAVKEWRRREATGTNLEGPQQLKISFPASIVPENSEFDMSRSSADLVPAGDIDCTFFVHNPHAGSGPNNTRVVKAKSSGSCIYTHSGPAPAPPTIEWDLYQVLFGGFLPHVWVASEHHTRFGLSPVWSSSSAQVFHTACVNGPVAHTNLVYVIPPSGYVYLGPQPITFAPTNAYVGNC
jgi:hypothetical protein